MWGWWLFPRAPVARPFIEVRFVISSLWAPAGEGTFGGCDAFVMGRVQGSSAEDVVPVIATSKCTDRKGCLQTYIKIFTNPIFDKGFISRI